MSSIVNSPIWGNSGDDFDVAYYADVFVISPWFLFHGLPPPLPATHQAFRALIYGNEIMGVEKGVARLFRLCLDIANDIGEDGAPPAVFEIAVSFLNLPIGDGEYYLQTLLEAYVAAHLTVVSAYLSCGRPFPRPDTASTDDELLHLVRAWARRYLAGVEGWEVLLSW